MARNRSAVCWRIRGRFTRVARPSRHSDRSEDTGGATPFSHGHRRRQTLLIRPPARGDLALVGLVHRDTLENNQALQQVIQLAERSNAPGRRARHSTYHHRARLRGGIQPAGDHLFQAGAIRRQHSDCQRVIGLNPYHFSALGGLFQCQMYLRRPGEALKTLRRAAKLQPHDTSFRDVIRSLEAQLTVDGRP